MKIAITPEKRSDGVERWRLSLFLRWSHEPSAKRYREGFASAAEAEARRKQLLTVAKAGGMDGVCALVWGSHPTHRGVAPGAQSGAISGGIVALAAQFVAAKERAGRRLRTTDNLERRLAVLAKLCGDVPPRTIQPAALQRWIDSTPISARSRINYGIVWRNFFRWCVRTGHLDASPMDRVELPSAVRVLPAVMDAYHVARLIAAAWYDAGNRREPGPMLAHYLLLFFSGVRPQEIRPLRWGAFSWDRGEVVLDESATKVSRVRHCRLDPCLARVLRVLMDRGDVPGYWSQRMVNRTRQRAGVMASWAIDIGRHTYASTRYALGTAEHDLSADMGNSVTVLRSHYINRLVSRDEAAKCWRILDAVADRLEPSLKAKTLPRRIVKTKRAK